MRCDDDVLHLIVLSEVMYIYVYMCRFLGMRNILYLTFAASLWWATGVYATFLVLTSYVHYFRCVRLLSPAV